MGESLPGLFSIIHQNLYLGISKCGGTMNDQVDEIIARAVAASATPAEAAVLVRESLERAGYVITMRPETDQAPDGYMPVFRASDR